MFSTINKKEIFMKLLEERLKIARMMADDLAGTMGENDRRELDRWLEESPAHREVYAKMRKRMQTGELVWEEQRRGERLVDGRWLSFEKRVVGKRRLGHRWMKYAALFLLPLAVAGAFLLLERGDTTTSVGGKQVAVVPGEAKVQLVLADGKRVELSPDTLLCMQEEGGVELQTSKNMLRYTKEDSVSVIPQVVYNQLIVPNGGEYHLQLSDGTMVWMNAGSTLRYPVAFGGNERKVEMTGEVYFEVMKNEKMPFVVTVRGMDVRVLGTSFNVSAYREEVVTTLLTGRVCLRKGNDQVVLQPDQQAIWKNKERGFVVKTVEARNYSLWKEGVFWFEGADLETILEDMSRWYDVNVFYVNPNLKNLRFNMEIKRYENIETVLKRLEQTRKVRFDVKDNAIYVYE